MVARTASGRSPDGVWLPAYGSEGELRRAEESFERALRTRGSQRTPSG